MNLTQKYLDDLTYKVVGTAIEFYKFMGRVLFKSVYPECLKEELKYRKINFLSEFKIPVTYKNTDLKIDFRCYLFIENRFVIKLKVVQNIASVFKVQLLNYMKLLKVPKGTLINFNSNNIFHE